VASAPNSFLQRRQAVLPAGDRGFRREAMLKKKKSSARFEYSPHFFERGADGQWRVAGYFIR